MSRLLAWITSAILVLLVFEGLTRLFTTSTALEPDAKLGWKYREEVHQTRETDGESWDFRTSRERLRAPEGYGIGEKPEGEVRVLLLGDSFTLGWGLEPQESFACLLEKRFREAKRPAKVIPAGTEGYSTDQECIWLEEHLASYKPNLVIVLPYANDVVWSARDRYLAYDKPKFTISADGKTATPPVAPVEDGRSALVRWSRLASKIQSLSLAIGSVLEVPAESGGGRMQLDDWVFLKKEPPEVEAGWRAVGAIATRMVEKAKAAGALLIAAPIPNRFEIHPEDAREFAQRAGTPPRDLDFSLPTRRWMTEFAATGTFVLDCSTALKEEAPDHRLYFRQDWHFNAEGAYKFAAALYKGLERNNLLPPEAPVRQSEVTLASDPVSHTGGLPTWLFVVAGLWVVLSIAFKVSYPDESAALAFVKVGALLTFVVGVFAGVNALTKILPSGIKTVLILGLVVGIGTYAIYKTRSRFGTIRELFGALVDRGHWYLVPMLVVMLSISILLVVAQNPIVAPFIYTLF